MLLTHGRLAAWAVARSVCAMLFLHWLLLDLLQEADDEPAHRSTREQESSPFDRPKLSTEQATAFVEALPGRRYFN